MSNTPPIPELSKSIYENERTILTGALKVSMAADHVAQVVEQFLHRVSARFDTNCATHNIKPACSAGCAYCCHTRVEVLPHEALFIARFIRATHSEAEQHHILTRVQTRAAQTAGLSRDAHFRARIPCAFLVDSRCSIYEARPTLCRTYHSMDVAPCRGGFENPTAGPRPVEQVAGLAETSKAAAQASRDAFKKARLDERPYELHQVVLTFLQDPNAEKRWRQGKRVGTPVPEWRPGPANTDGEKK